MVPAVKISPAMRKLIPFVTDDPSKPDGQIVHEVAFHVFPIGTGFAMRLGDNLLLFNADGVFAVSNARFCVGSNAGQPYVDACVRSDGLKNSLPDDPFFPEDTVGYEAEQASANELLRQSDGAPSDDGPVN